MPYSGLLLPGPNICEIFKHHLDLRKFLTISIIDAIVIKVVYLGFAVHVMQNMEIRVEIQKPLQIFNSKYFFWERFSQHRKYFDLATITRYTIIA